MDKVISGFKGNLGAIAGGAIVLGLIQVSVSNIIFYNASFSWHVEEIISMDCHPFAFVQIFGIVMACFVALYKRDDNKYEVV